MDNGFIIATNQQDEFKLVVDNTTDVISVEELAEDIDMLIWQEGVDFKITEDFKKSGKRTYLVKGLKMEIEDEAVNCDDYYNILRDNCYALMAFLKECVLKIYRTITSSERYGELIFSDGRILIEVIYN